ncbi:MAG: sigma 54-interacting transcriptional regulator, partial [Desulfosudaceae bacterium]
MTDHNSLEAARIEADLAFQALAQSDREAARAHFNQVLTRLNLDEFRPEAGSLLVKTTLALSHLNFILGRGFGETIPFLEAALSAAQHLGDRRSQALIKLHLARLYYFSDQREQALPLFEAGRHEVEELGDDDILTQSAEFLGLYFHIQGRFRQAVEHFERAVESFENDRGHTVSNPSAPIWLGYCAAYLGQFDRAIGILDYCRRLSLERGDHALAATTRAVLGIVLLELGSNREAREQIRQAITEAENTGNALALYFARGGLAYDYFTRGRLEDCHRCLARTIEEGAAAGLIRQYASPAFLEMGFALYQAGYTIHANLDFGVEFFRILQEPNIHLRGVLLRLAATEKNALHMNPAEAAADLENSESCLKTAGDPIQLAKTRFERIRLCQQEGAPEEARQLALQTRQDLAGCAADFFPDDLRPLLTTARRERNSRPDEEEFLVRFMDIIQALMPDPNLDSLLNRLLKSTTRYFGAERGALFWFTDQSRKKPPELRATCHLTEQEVFAPAFRSHLALVFEAFRQDAIQTVRSGRKNKGRYQTRAILCLPFKVSGATRGVLYHDNTYLPDCFNSLSRDQLNRLTHTLGSYIEHARGISRGMVKLAAETTSRAGPAVDSDLIGESPQMRKILEQTDKIAATDSTALILGETGTGKELIATRLHEAGPRRDRPLIIMDPTAVPEGLVESEMFGHEKGAFTGADRRRRGRLEMAHKGTLFIDEVGEIPK